MGEKRDSKPFKWSSSSFGLKTHHTFLGRFIKLGERIMYWLHHGLEQDKLLGSQGLAGWSGCGDSERMGGVGGACHASTAAACGLPASSFRC